MAQCATRLRGGGAGPRETFTFRDHPVATHALQEERGLANPRPAWQQLNVGAVAVLQASRAHLTSQTDHASVASACRASQRDRTAGGSGAIAGGGTQRGWSVWPDKAQLQGAATAWHQQGTGSGVLSCAKPFGSTARREPRP
jgi:hypothetical protein